MFDEFDQSDTVRPAGTKLPGQLEFPWELDEDEDEQLDLTSVEAPAGENADQCSVTAGAAMTGNSACEESVVGEMTVDIVQAEATIDQTVGRRKRRVTRSESEVEPVADAPVRSVRHQSRRAAKPSRQEADDTDLSQQSITLPPINESSGSVVMEHLHLKWGAKLPKVGFGFWKVEKQTTADICRQAIEIGYRHLDCACDYGNEVEVGQGIAAAIDAGICEREDLWVTSKLWNTYHAAEHVRPAFERSLNDLGLEYLDLYLIHFPIAQKFVPFETRYPPGWFTDPEARHPIVEEVRVSICETWQAMEDLAKQGLVKQIGVCNFSTDLLRDLLSYCHIRPAVLQVETHPHLTQERLLRYCQQERIAYTAFSPLGAQSYFSLGMADPLESVLGSSVVAEIAAAVGRTPAQVVLRWGVQRGTSVIPKTSSRERMIENISIFDFQLSDDQMLAISSLNTGRRYNDPGHFGEVAFNTFLPIYD